MKKLSLILITVLIFTTSMVFAEDSVPVTTTETVEASTEASTEPSTETSTETSTEAEQVPKNKGKGQQKQKALAEWKIMKDEAEAVKDANEASFETLKAQYEALLKSGDEAGAALLIVELDALKSQFVTSKADFKVAMNQRKLIAKGQYTLEELKSFEGSLKSISSNSSISKVLGIGSISVKKNLIKFDTPPYIKGGRTVVPVKAITEGLGAKVSFNVETFEVTIVKDDITIVLTIGSNIALVNGVPVKLDAKSEITNSRTYVPIKFIAETFGLPVEWDADTDTIDIEDGTVTEEVTTEATTEPVTEAQTQE